MGIPKLFNSFRKNNVVYTAIKEDINELINIDNLYIDFNSIVHSNFPLFLSDINEILNVLLSLKSQNELKNNETINKIVSKKEYKPYLDNFFNNFNKFNNETDIAIEFNKYFTNDIVDNIIIHITIKFIENMIDKYTNKLKLLYIAIDGVPSKSKMVEQIKRTYIGAVASEYKKKLFNENIDILKNTKTVYGSNKYIYEKVRARCPGDPAGRAINSMVFRIK